MERVLELRPKTACFTGHRKITEPVSDVEHRIIRVVEELVQKGYQYFGTGGARGFDALASEVILKVKQTYPSIHLIQVLPFEKQHLQEGNWTAEEIQQYRSIQAACSKTVVLSPEYFPGAYYQRNRYLVDHSSVCIAYMCYRKSGTGHTVNYAEKMGVPVINIAKKTRTP